MRVLGFPIVAPDVVLSRALSDLGALARAARATPAQLDRLLELGEEIVELGHRVLDLAERIDDRAEAILTLGQRLDRRTGELLGLGVDIRGLGGQIDARGAELVDRATQVVATGGDLLGVMPTLQRAIEMTAPLEGAIDRFGRLVDRLPGGAGRLRVPSGPAPDRPASEPDPSPGEPS